MSKEKFIKLGDNSESYKKLFNGVYDKLLINVYDNNPVCRMCLNYVIGRGFCNRYELCQTFCSDDDDDPHMIPICDKCCEIVHKYKDNNFEVCFLAINKKFLLDAIFREND